jgi:hypothetical protein
MIVNREINYNQIPEEKMKSIYSFLLSSFLTSLLLSPVHLGQDKIEEKINEIKGTADKIVINSDGKEYVFEGKEAEQIFEMLKRKSNQSFVWNTTDDDKRNKKVIIFNSNGDKGLIEITCNEKDDIIIKRHDDPDNAEDDMTKKIKVEIEDCNKKVTVTTKENGEEKTEVYEGKEAEEYLEKMKDENRDLEISIDKDHDGKKVKKIIIKTEKEEAED